MKNSESPWHIRISDEDEIIRLANSSKYIGDLERPKRFGISKEEFIANARLIAASPELLLALKDARQWLKELGANQYHESWDKIESAIFKAERRDK